MTEDSPRDPALPAPDQLPAPLRLATADLVLEQRAQQRDFLLRIGRAMTARLDLRDVLTEVIRYAVEITGGRAGAIAMRQPSGRLELAASYRLDELYDFPFAGADAAHRV